MSVFCGENDRGHIDKRTSEQEESSAPSEVEGELLSCSHKDIKTGTVQGRELDPLSSLHPSGLGIWVSMEAGGSTEVVISL